MKNIPINGKNGVIDHVQVSDDDFETLSKRKWHFRAKKYAMTYMRIDGKQKNICMHHLIIGKPERGFVVDHIDGNPKNNQRDNLHIVTYAHNSHNRSFVGKNKFRGVYKVSKCNRWKAKVQKINYGVFDRIDKAAERYDICAYLIFGKTALTNGLVTYEEALQYDLQSLKHVSKSVNKPIKVNTTKNDVSI